MRLREQNIELMRLIACIMVIILHTGAIYGREVILEYPSYYFTVGNLFHSVTRNAVPIFIMISGGFLLDNIKNIDYRNHYNKTFNKIIVPTFIFSFLYVVYSLCIGKLQSITTGEQFNYINPIINWIKGIPFSHMWYMYMIIGCYGITPILIRVRLNIEPKKFEILGWIFMVLGIVLNIIQLNLIWPISFIPYLGYFILGYSLKKKKVKSNSYLIYLLGSIILLILIFFITEINIRYNIMENKFYFLQPLSPIVIISSIWMYISFLNMKNININIYKVSKHTFNIYLLHAGILNIIHLGVSRFLIEYPNPIWYIPLLSTVVFIISYIGSITLNYIYIISKDNTQKREMTY